MDSFMVFYKFPEMFISPFWQEAIGRTTTYYIIFGSDDSRLEYWLIERLGKVTAKKLVWQMIDTINTHRFLNWQSA